MASILVVQSNEDFTFFLPKVTPSIISHIKLFGCKDGREKKEEAIGQKVGQNGRDLKIILHLHVCVVL
jgi:hypothetical protein